MIFLFRKITAMLTVKRKFKNNTRSRIGHDHKVCFIQSSEGYRGVCIFLASLFVTLHSLT